MGDAIVILAALLIAGLVLAIVGAGVFNHLTDNNEHNNEQD